MASARCTAIAKSGKPCTAVEWKDGLCLWHHPDAAERQREIRSAGGRATSNAAKAQREWAQHALSTEDFDGLIGATAIGVMSGRITPGVANAIANLARARAAVAAAAEFEAELAEMRQDLALIHERRRLA